MDEKLKEMLKELLFENLTIKIANTSDYDYNKLKVTLLFDGKEIDSDYVHTKEGLIKF